MEETQYIKELLGKPNKAEALSWLKASSEASFRSLGEFETNEESVELVQRLYALGAVEVTAVDIDAYPEGQNTGKLIISLPDDPEGRKRLFAWSGEQSRSLGFDPEQDVGQKHLLVGLD